MQYYTVLDTNVLVSALLSKNADSSTVRVMDAMFQGAIIPVYNDEIMQEYLNVLYRPKFRFSNQAINTLLQSLIDNGICVDRMDTGEILPDPKDLVFYEIAMAKREDDAMLVTGNLKHFPIKPFIVSPKELLEIIGR